MSYRKIILILFLGIFLSAERNAKAQTVKTFNYVDTVVQNWTVPCGVSSATVKLWGAGGGSGLYFNYTGEYAGGSGAYTLGVLTGIAPGMVLQFYIPKGGQWANNGQDVTGGNGGAGGWPGGGLGGQGYAYDPFYGGGGGGYAAIKYNGKMLVVCGAGGGGGGYAYYYANGGGGGGGITHAGGTGGNNYGPTSGGVGGTLTSGGTYGTNNYVCSTPTNGSFLQGGFGGGYASCYDYEYGGGGGGGGYYGGGGGGDQFGGGGGGSSYPATSASFGGITFSVVTNTIGNFGPTEAVYTAPGSPAAGIGVGGWMSNGGNGAIVLSYDSSYIPTGVTGSVLNNILCNGQNTGEVVANVTGGGPADMSFFWSPGGATTDTVKNTVANIYTVTIVNNYCGGSASAQVTLTQPAFFACTPTINNILCNGETGSIVAGGTGGTLPYTYAFTPGGDVPAIYNLTAGTYSLNMLDNRGCATSELITISQPNAISIETSMVTAPNCYGGNGGSLLANVTGGSFPFNYAWSPAGGSNAAASGLTGGTYTLTVTDKNGCTESAPATVSQPAYLGVRISPPLLNLACNGDNNGVLGSGVEGGTRPYTYAWSGGRGSDSDVMNLSAGTYSLTVTDVHGCVTVVSGIVNQPPPMNLSVDSTFDDGSCSGSAWVVLSGATPPYSYLWSNTSTEYYQSGLCKGHYCCRVTDANGCIYDKCTYIESDLGVGNVSGNSGKITVYPNPNNGTFTVASTVDGGHSVIEVYNVLGEKVYTTTLNASKGENNSVNMGNQATGIYLYRVMTEGGNLLGEGKIVLQK